jgi:hypothetical protein
MYIYIALTPGQNREEKINASINPKNTHLGTPVLD